MVEEEENDGQMKSSRRKMEKEGDFRKVKKKRRRRRMKMVAPVTAWVTTTGSLGQISISCSTSHVCRWDHEPQNTEVVTLCGISRQRCIN